MIPALILILLAGTYLAMVVTLAEPFWRRSQAARIFILPPYRPLTEQEAALVVRRAVADRIYAALAEGEKG